MNAKKKERQVMQHPRMAIVFEERNTKQSQQLMELRPKDLENASDWYAWCLYWDIVPLHVKKLHTLVKDLDDKLDGEGAVVSKSKLIDRVIEYRERRQALLFCVDFMLSLTNEETQKRLSRSVTEWDECFAKLESSWGYWFPDVHQMLKCPIDGTKELKLSQMTNGTSADAAMRCPRKRKLRQRPVHQAKPNCVKETASEKESLTRSRKTKDHESCCGMRDSISELENSINDVTSLLEENSKVSDVTIQMDNRPTVSTKWSNGDRLVPLALEKAEDQKSDEVQSQRRETGQLEIEELGKHPKLVETRSNRSSVISKSSSARRVLYLKIKAQKEQEELQTRIEKLRREAKERERAAFQEALARKARIAELERQIEKASSSQGISFPSNSSVDSFMEDSRCMDETERAEDGAKSNIGLSAHSKSENAVKLVHEGKFSELRRDSKPPTEAVERADWKDSTNVDNGRCSQGATSQPDVKVANKGTSKFLTAECIQNLSETIVVENCRQDLRSETFLMDTKQLLEEEIHLVSEQSIVQTQENLNYTLTETRKEHRSLTFASCKQTLEESSVQFELLQESAEVITVQQDVQQGKLFEETRFYASKLLLEEGNKCFEFVKWYGFVHEKQFVLQHDWNEGVMYQKQCHVEMKDGKTVKDNARDDKQTMNATFGRKSDFDFEINLVEEAIPSPRNAWNTWIGNGNSGMDAVSQANDIDKTQLSKGHRKQQKKRTWKIEPLSNLIHGMAKGAQLNVNGTPQDEPLWLHDLRDKSSVTRTQMCSLKAPTAASWSNGSCNGPAAPFMTMWTQYGSFGELEVSDNNLEPDRNPDATKLECCGGKSSVTLYKQNGERNSMALQLFGENLDVATKNDVSVSNELNVVQRLSLKHKCIPFGCTYDTENKGKIFRLRNVEKSLYLLIMMMDDSTTLQEERIQNRIMERSENELVLTYLPRSQSTLMRKCVAEQILGNWLEIISTYLEIYSLDVEVILEAELNEQKLFCIIPFKRSREKLLVELNECRTLMIKFVIIGKIATSNGKTVLEIFCCVM